MSIQADKYQLIEWITSLNDLAIINRLKSIQQESSPDWWDDLSKVEKENIEKGLDDIKEGRVHSHENVMNELKKRVNL